MSIYDKLRCKVQQERAQGASREVAIRDAAQEAANKLVPLLIASGFTDVKFDAPDRPSHILVRHEGPAKFADHDRACVTRVCYASLRLGERRQDLQYFTPIDIGLFMLPSGIGTEKMTGRSKNEAWYRNISVNEMFELLEKDALWCMREKFTNK